MSEYVPLSRRRPFKKDIDQSILIDYTVSMCVEGSNRICSRRASYIYKNRAMVLLCTRWFEGVTSGSIDKILDV